MLAKNIGKKRAQELINKGALLVDVRNPVAFRNGSLPDAINLPLRSISTLRKYPSNTKIIFFGEADDDKDLELAANYAWQMGFVNLFSLGSIDNWNK